MIRLAEFQFIESVCGLVLTNSLESSSCRFECKFVKRGEDFELACSPSVSERIGLLRKAAEDAEKLVFDNRKLLEFLNKLSQLSFVSPASNLGERLFDAVDKRLQQVGFQEKKESVLTQAGEDLEQAEQFVAQFEDLK